MTTVDIRMIALQRAIEVSDRKWYTEDVLDSANKFYEFINKEAIDAESNMQKSKDTTKLGM